MNPDQWLTVAAILIPLGSAIAASHVRTGNRLTILEIELKNIKEGHRPETKSLIQRHELGCANYKPAAGLSRSDSVIP